MIRRGFLVVAFCIAFLPAVPRAETGPHPEIEAVSKPSADVTLSFVRGGRVVQVSVREGETVKAKQFLARQDDEAEQIQLKQLAALAADKTRIQIAEAELAQKRVDLVRFEDARKKGAATDWETEHARLAVVTAELQVALARFENEQNRLKHNELKAEVERLRLGSPIDGRVEEVSIEPGEAAQPLAPVIRVVRIDPLWIDVPVPLAQARGLRPHGQARVTYPGKAQSMGRIVHVSAVADAASGTLRVRVEVPNPSRRPAGEHVSVSFADAKGGGQ
jgi:RND family efflux transporter MFP subunit